MKKHLHWRYEYKTFNLKDSTYTPDFYLIDKNRYIEIKGDKYLKSLLKVNKFRKLYKIKLIVLKYKALHRLGVFYA